MDKLNDKYDCHSWKMTLDLTLDLTLEEHEVLDYVQEKVVEPPSIAPTAAKTKHRKGEVKAKKICFDYIQKLPIIIFSMALLYVFVVGTVRKKDIVTHKNN